ncbi:hypothetical protein G9A89_005092 [Geosiphon pyriformis]|nr:hypothetical protein G9A89_005092 [Geosiphon pyriformis]
MSHSVSFSGVTWASVVSGSPKNLYSTLLVETNSSIELVDSLTPAVTILASHVSVFEHSLENMFDQVADISHKLNRLLAVLSVNFTVSLTSEHNPVLNMAVDTLLFIPPVLNVVTVVSQDIFPSGSHVLTIKVSGLKANLMVLENSVKTILSKLDFFGSGSSVKIATYNVRGMNILAKQDDIIRWYTVSNNDISIVTETKLCSSVKPWIANKFPSVRVFTSGLDAEFLDADVILIMNKNLAKHVSKISEIPDVWVSLDSINASAIKSFFLLESYFDAIRSALVKIRKSYHSLKIIELKCVKNSQIRLAINKRIKNFELNKGQTIRSVLERPFYKVTLNHLIVNKNLILESGLVKFHVDRIIEGWTRKHVVVDDISNEWLHQFQPLKYVFDDVFSNVMYPIEVEEFLGVILNLPDNKAASLSDITNEL